MRTSTYAAALAVPTLLAFSAVAPEKISFAPKAGTSVTKTFTTITEMELEDMEVLVGGQAPPMGDPEMTLESSQTVTVSDTYGEMKDGQLTSLSRTFDGIELASDMEMTGAMAQDISIEGSSPLEGKTVEFKWNEKDETHDVAYAKDEEGEAEHLEGLTLEMDLTGLLPTEDISVGDSYDIGTGALAQILGPGGDLAIEVDGGGGMGMPGSDPSQMGDFSAFFDEGVDGSGTGKLKEIRDVDGIRVAVIEIEFDVSGSADLSEAMEEGMKNNDDLPAGVDMAIDRMEMAMTYEGSGELLWNLDAGHVHSLDMEGEVTTEMDMAMTMNGEMQITTDMAMAGKVVSKVETE